MKVIPRTFKVVLLADGWQVQGIDSYGHPATVSTVLSGFSEQGHAQEFTIAWATALKRAGVGPFTPEGIAVARKLKQEYMLRLLQKAA